MFILFKMTVREMARHTTAQGVHLTRVKLINDEREGHSFNLYVAEDQSTGMYLGMKVQLTVASAEWLAKKP